ncbi:hypothetical protein HU200_037394 [Digitaria exilis]|uniref:NAD(P)H dehydrogenase (quinone) n=1 Tax=Digitaria exilis TaxID=1010633 RepID=A0A835BES6_9POAL|nr:hypothetical protein HU200_037394 [Digitaria exilis]
MAVKGREAVPPTTPLLACCCFFLDSMSEQELWFRPLVGFKTLHVTRAAMQFNAQLRRGRSRLEDQLSESSSPALPRRLARHPYYSTWGHVATLAEEIKKGVDSVAGVESTVWRVPETLPEEVLGKMHAAPKREEHPVITAAQLAEADGILLGFPTRFGMMAAQMKAFIDSTGGLWRTQALPGKPAGLFFATGSQGGGQETTALTAVTQLAHHGMLFVPIGATFGAGMFGMDEVRGGGPYGAGTFAGTAEAPRTPSDTELAMARHQGSYFAAIAKKLKDGGASLAGWLAALLMPIAHDEVGMTYTYAPVKTESIAAEHNRGGYSILFVLGMRMRSRGLLPSSLLPPAGRGHPERTLRLLARRLEIRPESSDSHPFLQAR